MSINSNNDKTNNSNNSAKSVKANGIGGNLKKKKKKCRWGDACRNKKCGFVHPTKINNQDDKAVATTAVIVDDEAEKSSMNNDDAVTKKSNDDPPLDNSNVAPSNDNEQQQLMYSTSPPRLTNDGTTNINDDNSYSPQLLFAKGITNDNIVTTTTTSSHNPLFVNNTNVNVGVGNDGNNNIHSNYNSHQLTEECDWMYEVLGLNHHRNPHRNNHTNQVSVNNTGQTNFHGMKSSLNGVMMNNYDNTNNNVIPQNNDYQQRINNVGGYTTTAATPKGNLGIMDNGYYHHHSNATPMNHVVNTNAAARNDYGKEESTVMMGIIDGHHHHPINNANINTLKNHHGQGNFNVDGYMHQSNIVSPKNHEMQQQHGIGYNTTTCSPMSYNTNDGMQHNVVARVTTTPRMSNNNQYHPSGEDNNAMARGGINNATSILYNNVNHRVVPPRSNVIPASGYNDDNVGATVESPSSSTPSSSRVFSNTKASVVDKKTDNHYFAHDNRNISTVTNNSNTPSTKAVSEPYTNHNRKVYLLSTTEIENYRNTALELQFLLSTTSSPTKNNNNTTAKLLLQQCRTNQRHIQSLLQNHMNSNSVVDEVDEGNLMDILELNELLLNAIDEGVTATASGSVATTGDKSCESVEQSSSPLNGVGDKDVNKKKKLLNGDNGKKQNTIALRGEQQQKQQLHSGVEGGVKQVKIKKGKKENQNISTAT
eukprot:scaffold99176_cov21-Cyclotella_meneghiniana.AAC.1